MSRLTIAGFILVALGLGRPASAEPCTERDAGAVSKSFPGALVLACGPALRDGRAVQRVEAATADGRRSFALTLSDGKSELRLEFDETWKPLEPR